MKCDREQYKRKIALHEIAIGVSSFDSFDLALSLRGY